MSRVIFAAIALPVIYAYLGTLLSLLGLSITPHIDVFLEEDRWLSITLPVRLVVVDILQYVVPTLALVLAFKVTGFTKSVRGPISPAGRLAAPLIFLTLAHAALRIVLTFGGTVPAWLKAAASSASYTIPVLLLLAIAGIGLELYSWVQPEKAAKHFNKLAPGKP